MKTTVLFFGRLSDQLGREREVEIPEAGCTIAALKAQLAAEEPTLAEALANGTIRAAIEQEMASDDAMVRPGQEVALFSPLSGG